MKKTGIFKKSIRNDNRGSALIVCIIILLFVSILATVILYMSGINYRMKKSDYKTRVAFYDSEMALENMKANLIIPYSEALDNGFRVTNTRYSESTITGGDDRRAIFYTYVYDDLMDLLLDNYSGSTVGSTLRTGTNSDTSLPIRNIIQNLTWDNIDANNGCVAILDQVNDLNNRVYANETATDYSATPIAYVNDLSSVQVGGAYKYFVNDGTYIVLPANINKGNADDNYKSFVQLDVYNTPNDPTSGLLAPDKCRIMFKNVCVVTVKDGYRSIVVTDIALQFPPLDWDGGAADGYKAWNVYQLIYYVNWQKY